MSITKSGTRRSLPIGILLAAFAVFAFVAAQLAFIGSSTRADAKDALVGAAIVAPLVDHGKDAASDNNEPVDVEDYAVAASSDVDGVIDLEFTATGLPAHYNGAHMKAYWIGFGIPYTKGDSYATTIQKADEAAPKFTDADYSPDNNTSETTQGPVLYKTFYCGSYTTLSDRAFYVSVKNGSETRLYKATFADVKCQYSITYAEAEHGAISGAAVANEGDSVTVTDTPDDGYYLSGLRIEGVTANGIVEAEDGTFTMSAYDVIVTPTFTANPKVKFVNEDGTVLSEAAYEPGTPAENIKRPADPKKQGNAGYSYEFVGWTPEVVDMGIVDVTYTAIYKTVSKATAATGVEAKGAIFSKGLLAGESIELFAETPSLQTQKELTERYSKEIDGASVGGIFTVDLLKHLANGAVQDVDNESVGQLTISFPVDASDGTKANIIQLHDKKGSTTPEVIVHKNLKVKDGKVEVTLDGKLSTFIITTQGNVDGVAMHRLYNPNSGEHFYTSDEAEFENLVSLGWNDESIGWIAPKVSKTPVYRLYNAIGGEHHYTMDASERDHLVSLGWNDEGTGWYSDDAKGKVLYREYNPNAFANNHNYTTDEIEHNVLIEHGWNDEGYAWYGLNS